MKKPALIAVWTTIIGTVAAMFYGVTHTPKRKRRRT